MMKNPSKRDTCLTGAIGHGETPEQLGSSCGA